MATKPDFGQKLLHDLRLRKEHLATAQNSGMHGNWGQNLKGSRGTKTLEPVGPKIRSRYTSSSNRQKSPATVQTANQLVPYSGGHHSGQVADLSMALSYAFDNRGKLKRLDIASNSAMMDLLQQVGRRSMQQSLDIQWQSTNQFPTLTHLHIDEIAKGTQKLNQILRACSSGINIDEGSIEIGKELWKGAMELEQSLRMLVSLQEASESKVNQQMKSRLKLLNEDGDSEDDSAVCTVKQKQVERPVFSFDKPSKKTKASVQTNLQPKLTALPFLEDPNSKPEMAPKIIHRRSTSCGPEIQTSHLTNSSKTKHNTARLPNVIAKLMGLEELPQNIDQKVAAESPFSQQRSRELVSVHSARRSSKSAQQNASINVSQNKVQSNKITILKTHKIEVQEETNRLTNSHRTTSYLEKPTWNQEEREGIKDYVKESKGAIFKINELQSKTIHLSQDGRSQTSIRKEEKVRSLKQKQHEVTDATENRNLITAETMQADTLGNPNTHEATKTATRKPLIPPQKLNQDIQSLQINIPSEPQGKKLKAENRSPKREKRKSEFRKKESNAERLQNSRKIARDTKHMQKQLPIKQPNAEKKYAEDIGFVDSKALDGKFTESDDIGTKSSVSLRSDQKGPKIDGLSDTHMIELKASSNMDTKCTHDSARMKASEIKPPKDRPLMKKNEDITKAGIAPRTIARELRTQRPSSYRMKQNKLNKINVSREAAEANKSIAKTTESIAGNHETSKQLVYEESQQNIDAKQKDLKKQFIQDDQTPETEVTIPTQGDEGECMLSTLSGDQQEQAVHEVKVTLQITETDGKEDLKSNSWNQHQKQQKQQMPAKMVKQEPLTEDELFLKQKLITSHLFLNTAEAMFKLNIPISILNYASDQNCEAKDSKIILDCGYELLKRKGKQEIFFCPNINVFMTCTKIRCLDDLVRKLHRDFEALKSYGRNGRDEKDYASFIHKMMECDIHNKHPDLNCMWDLDWNEVMFPCGRMDEVIVHIEQLVLDELVKDLINDCL